MHRNISLLISILILGIISCEKRTGEFKESILGTWKLVKEERQTSEFAKELFSEMSNGMADMGIVPDTSVQELSMFIQEDGYVDFVQFGYQTKGVYYLKDSTFSVFSKHNPYKILKLTDSILVYTDDDRQFGNTISYFKRIDDNITPIPMYEMVEENYLDGNPRVRGYKEGGQRLGIWVEWTENELLDTLIYFSQPGIPGSTFHFDEAGAFRNYFDDSWKVDQEFLDDRTITTYERQPSKYDSFGGKYIITVARDGWPMRLQYYRQELMNFDISFDSRSRIIDKKWLDIYKMRHRSE